MNDHEQLLADLRLVRERMSDPGRVVLDPDSLYEDEIGRAAYWPRPGQEEPERACVIGWCCAVGYDPVDSTLASGREIRMTDLLELKYREQSEEGTDNLTLALRRGEHVAVIDAAIAEAEAAVLAFSGAVV